MQISRVSLSRWLRLVMEGVCSRKLCSAQCISNCWEHCVRADDFSVDFFFLVLCGAAVDDLRKIMELCMEMPSCHHSNMHEEQDWKEQSKFQCWASLPRQTVASHCCYCVLDNVRALGPLGVCDASLSYQERLEKNHIGQMHVYPWPNAFTCDTDPTGTGMSVVRSKKFN